MLGLIYVTFIIASIFSISNDMYALDTKPQDIKRCIVSRQNIYFPLHKRGIILNKNPQKRGEKKRQCGK